MLFIFPINIFCLYLFIYICYLYFLFIFFYLIFLFIFFYLNFLFIFVYLVFSITFLKRRFSPFYSSAAASPSRCQLIAISWRFFFHLFILYRAARWRIEYRLESMLRSNDSNLTVCVPIKTMLYMRRTGGHAPACDVDWRRRASCVWKAWLDRRAGRSTRGIVNYAGPHPIVRLDPDPNIQRKKGMKWVGWWPPRGDIIYGSLEAFGPPANQRAGWAGCGPARKRSTRLSNNASVRLSGLLMRCRLGGKKLRWKW